MATSILPDILKFQFHEPLSPKSLSRKKPILARISNGQDPSPSGGATNDNNSFSGSPKMERRYSIN